MSRAQHSYHLQLDLASEGPLPRRLSRAIIRALAEGQLNDGDTMPSTRMLAMHVGVSRSAVVSAYEELTASGFLVARGGSATIVEIGARQASNSGVITSTAFESTARVEVSLSATTPRYNLLPGLPDPALLNRRSWSAAWRHAAAADTADSWGDGDLRHSTLRPIYHFFPELRLRLAEHVRRTRSIVCDPEDIFIFSGFTAALRTLVPTLVDSSGTVAFEDPGYLSGKRAVQQSGRKIRPVPVDENGIVVDLLRPTDTAVYVTPAHQFPLGARMTIDRRRKLLEWATDTSQLIFEDDYDGEFRYDVPPMPALRSLNRGSERVVYLGTTSKVLSRDFRLAWAIVPRQFRERVRSCMIQQGDSANPVAVRALTHILESGAMLRQIASSSRAYAARRTAFAAAIGRSLPQASLHGIEAGLHFVLSEPRIVDDVAVVRELAERGVVCLTLSEHYFENTNRMAGLVCGYSRLPQSLASSAVGLIAEVIAG